LVILFALIWLIAHLILLADGGGSASSLKGRLAMEVRSPLPTHVPGRPSATSTLLGIGSMMALGSAQPTPTPTSTTAPTRIPSHPSPTANTASGVRLVVARGVDGETPVEQSSRFLSPALRLWAVAKVKDVRATDVLRFVFQRNGVVLPHDDISVVAGRSMNGHRFLAEQSFKVWADYEHGAKPLPTGSYRLLFYKNSRLEGQTAFRVG
jgi:hypothetical protein